MSGPSFWQFMKSHTINFDGTRFSLLVDGHNTVPFTIARQPSGDYWDKLLSMFEIARKFDPTIELTIAFCVEYHETQIQTAGSNNRIFPTKVIDITPIPSNVIRFFQFLPVKILLDNFKKLNIEVRDTTSRLQGLEQLQKELDAVIKETIRLRPEMAKCQSELEKAEQDLEALRRLQTACKEVKDRFEEKLEAHSPLFREQKLMAETKERRDSLFEKLQAFSEKKWRVSKQKQELSSLKKEQPSLLDFLKITEQKLVKTKNEFLSCFERLYPRTIKVLTRADFSEYLQTLDSASEPCDDAWKDFRRSDFIWHTQMPVLFGLMITEMVKTSLSKSRLHKPMHLLSFHGLFVILPKDMQKFYVPHRFWVINHSFLLILSSKLTNTCMGRRFSLKIQMRFLARLANKMLFRFRMEFFKLQRLSICI